MANKTIYVSDEDMPLYRRAQELSGSNLSAAISAALRRYVEIEEGRLAGYDEVVLRVGVGAGRKVRFSGVLLGQWERSTSYRSETFRVFRSRKGKFVAHTERDEEWTPGPDAPKGWRAHLSGNWDRRPAEASMIVADTVGELRDKIPAELYEMVVQLADQPEVEDLDI
jgi:EXLDI family protein